MKFSCRVKTLGVLATLNFFLLAGCENPAAINESSANVKHVTQADFADEVTRSPLPVVVDFYATWCGACRQLAPLLDRVAGGYAGKIKFVKVNVDESPGLAQNYKAEALPTVVMFHDGKLADRIVGVPPEADLKTKLDALAPSK